MGARSVVPGLLLIIAAVVLLALVSFNTPLLKSLYFLEARFKEYTLKLGTLGYCLDSGGTVSCQGPQVGYEFDLNKVLNLSNAPFNIPTAVSKYLTYVLIIHIISLGFAVLALLTGLMELIPGCVMMCFPTCLAGIAGGLALIVFIFDIAIFFIARSRINSVSGASATVGAAVWMTLAAWLCCSFAGCAYGMGRACCWDSGERGGTRRRTRRERQEEEAAYRRDEALRLQAIHDDKRRQQEQDLPNFATFERQPLTSDTDDKYYYQEEGVHAVPALHHDAGPGHGIQGVGVGYGRRVGATGAGAAMGAGTGNVQRQPSVGSTFTQAGAAGVGAGGAGVEVPNRYDGYAAYQVPQTYQPDNYNRTGYEHTYTDPYTYNGSGPSAHNYDNTSAGYAHAYDPTPSSSNPYATAAVPSTAAAAAAGAAVGAGAMAGTRNRLATTNGDNRANRTSFHSSDNYHDPGARVHPTPTEGQYDYADDYEAIGRAATSPSDPRYRTPPAPPAKSRQTAQSLDSQYTQYTSPTTNYSTQTQYGSVATPSQYSSGYAPVSTTPAVPPHTREPSGGGGGAYGVASGYGGASGGYGGTGGNGGYGGRSGRSGSNGEAYGGVNGAFGASGGGNGGRNGGIRVPQPQPSGQFFVANRTASPVSEYPTEYSRDSEYTTDTGRPPSYGQVAQGHVYSGDTKRPF